MYDEENYLQLSRIQHFQFCRRQWALIHIEQQWSENYLTTDGILKHKRAHDEGLMEKRGDLIIAHGMRINSAELGLSGQCDIVEFRKNENGITLHGYEDKWQVYPVEYKRGEEKTGDEDRLQLCAQAMCLEEMFVTSIPVGYLFYESTKRREKVELNGDLREVVKKISLQMHDYFRRGRTPVVKTSAKCRACSLKELCLPKLEKSPSVEKYIADHIGKKE